MVIIIVQYEHIWSRNQL